MTPGNRHSREQMIVHTLGGLGGGVLTGGVGAVQGVVATCTYLFSVTGAGAAMGHGSLGANRAEQGVGIRHNIFYQWGNLALSFFRVHFFMWYHNGLKVADCKSNAGMKVLGPQ